ncbi:hypothetical protein ACAW74_08855 [Fibrella sp. WM1]|uniref:hypothetical protein n=1 Tax=Fibrella musci TaxID=3242485 RepID=UPI00351FF17C
MKTFSRPVSDEQVLEIKQLLADYFARKVDEDVDALFEQQGWNAATAERWLTEHNRTPYQHD